MRRPTAKTFEDLIVWQKAHVLALDVYRRSGQFPPTERYGLANQLRRAAFSVCANIAEGFKRRPSGDKVRFLNIAQASLEEVRYGLILARDLGYLRDNDWMERLEEVSRLLEGYAGAIMASGS